MSLTDILNDVTIVNDCSVSCFLILVAAYLAGLLAILGIIAIISKIVYGSFARDIFQSVVLIIGSVIMIIALIFGIWYYNTYPQSIKMYVCAGNIPVTELSTYFTLDQVSEIDDNTFLYIQPKAEYYGETLEWYRQNVK